jgi:hypothetical protein
MDFSSVPKKRKTFNHMMVNVLHFFGNGEKDIKSVALTIFHNLFSRACVTNFAFIVVTTGTF